VLCLVINNENFKLFFDELGDNMKTKFQCDICKQLYDTEVECLNCENSHADKILCQYESGDGFVDAICSVLKFDDRIDVIFEWEIANGRKSQRRFKFDSNIRFEVEFIEEDSSNSGEGEESVGN